jgi:predicted ATPase/serine phosphatase RsbU (regulator of sigma subunit)
MEARGQTALAGRFLAERELYRSSRTLVEVGTWNGRRVVAKRSADAGSAAAKSRAAYEHQLLSLARSEYVVGAIALNEREGLILLEFVEGGSLLELPLPLSLPQFLAIAHDVCLGLAAVHEAQLIHKDINPSNLLRTRDGRTKLIDFDIATRARWETQDFRAPSQIEGTLAFIAPEQTGRTNRPLDYRVDLYGLGATFYYLLCGRPPFEARDPLELLHRHVAATPPSLSGVPRALDALVQKLLAKNAEERYQSALGVLRDLERLERGELGMLGVDDVSHRLTLPMRLVGREREVATLQRALRDALSAGRARVALIGGSSGVGKTALVRELRRQLVGTRGHYLHGKYDPFRRNVPYSGLASALGGHVGVLLGESQDELEACRRRLAEALGEEAGALVALFPMLSPLLGPADADTTLSPRELQARGGRLLQRLFGALATREQPMLLFLDDLQWADPATLEFVERFAREGRFALVTGAYRDDELEPIHPLREHIMRLDEALIAHIALGPLSSQDALAFLAEALHLPGPELEPLAAVLYPRSGGSPFFLGQALLELSHAGVLRMRGGRWSWDAAGIDSFALSDKVVDISATRIASAPALTRELLCWAACLGSEFELAELVSLAELDPASSEEAVERAAGEGLLTVRGRGRYAFLHDRVRQAAYEVRSEAERRVMHRQIALALIAQGHEQARLFEVVSHLTAMFCSQADARASSVDQSAAAADRALCLRAADLNLVAARRAHASGAFDAAAGFAESCRALLTAAGERGGDAYRKANMLYGEAQYSRGRYREAHQAYDELLQDEHDPVERSAIYRQKAVAKTVEGLLEEAFAYFGVLARELGFDFNTMPSAEEAAGMVAWARESLVEFGCEELERLPPCEETYSSVLIDACLYFGSIAYLARPASFKALQSYTLIHCFDWGVSASAPPMITAWAVSAASARDYPLALSVARAGCRLAQQYSPPRVAARARTLFALFAAHYELSAEDCLEELRSCAEICALHGDLEYAGHARSEHDGLLALTQGGSGFVSARVAHTHKWADDFQVVPCMRATALTRGFVERLAGGEVDAAELAAAGSRRPAWAHGLELALQVLLGDYAAGARSYAEYVRQREQLESSASFTLFAFFGAVALTLAQDGSELGAAQRLEAIELVTLHARLNPGASEPYALLLSALSSRAEGPVERAALFDAVIEQARRGRLPLLSALACALAGESLRGAGHARLARSFAEDAAREFSALSAHAAVRALQRRFLNVELRSLAPAPLDAQGGTFIADARTLDVWTVVKASQTLASELRLAPLIARLLDLARETAGAQRAVLLTRAVDARVPAREPSNEALEIAADLHGELTMLGGEALEGSARLPVALVLEAFRQQEPIAIHDAARDPKWSRLDYFRRAEVRSVLCMPVRRGDERYGLLYLENALTAGAFSAGRVEVLRVLAGQAAVSLENARLVREEAEKHKLRHELEAAAEIQRALVPAEPTLRGAEVCAHMAPADQVGGDYYDVVRAGGHEWFVMADVCGHGLAAGLIMIMCQTALHAVLRGQPEIDPVTALAQVNQLLKANLERFRASTYVAATLFRYGPDGSLEYAGLHEDILIYRHASGSVEVHATSGTWLGIVDELAPLLRIERLQLAPGDVLLLYTDGLIDARPHEGGAPWGREALEALLASSGTLPLETIRARILAAVEPYRRTDDVTLLLLRR